MITNGRVQLWPFLRVALFLVVGVLIGDALDCRVPSCVWMWAYVALFSAFVASYFFLRKHPIFQTVVLFIMVVAGGLWRTTCFLEDYNVPSPVLQKLLRLSWKPNRWRKNVL